MWSSGLILMNSAPIDVAHSVFDTSYRDSNHFFNEALGTNSKDSPHPYNFRHIDFKEGDVVIDIGGNLGLTSICLARMYPFLTIYCFEPIEENFRYLLRNLEMNHITNVHAFQLAVTSDGRPMEFTFNETRSVRSGNVVNAQMASSYHPKMVSVRSIAFDEIFRLHGITKCKLLKIDCEGSEYDILNQTALLPAIEYICGETHGGKEETLALFKHLKRHIPKEKMAFTIVGSKNGNYCLGEIEEDELFN
jgi:FkbM family methyltransferase